MNVAEKAAIFRSERFLEHDTGDHVENAFRLTAIERELTRQDLLSVRALPEFAGAKDEQLERAHDPRYVAALRRFAEQGGGWIDGDTFCGEKSFDVAALAAGAVCGAVDWALGGSSRRAFV